MLMIVFSIRVCYNHSNKSIRFSLYLYDTRFFTDLCDVVTFPDL